MRVASETTSIEPLLTDEQYQMESLKNRIILIRSISLILLLSSTGFGISMALNGIPNLLGALIITINVVSTLIYLTVFIVSWQSITVRRTDVLSVVLAGSMLVTISSYGIVTKMVGNMPASFMAIPVIAGLVGLRPRNVAIITIVSGFLLGGFYSYWFLIEKPVGDNPGLTGLFSWLVLFVLICGGITIFISRQSRTTARLEEQTARLTQVLGALNSTTEVGVGLSRRLAGVTAELHHTSREQASSTQEQVAAVTEVTTSLEELSETADQIAQSARGAAGAAGEAVQVANEVKEASQLAQTTVREGSNAVAEAVSSVERVRNRIELLGQRLLNLTEQTRRVGNIIDIIDEIADETHLLALNASIEAAGNVGGETTSIGTRGERFGVIAQEIKNLSDRSREATEEVRQTIGEIQGAVAAAVLVAEEGKKETAASLSRSQIAGAVIHKLNNVITGSASSADEILASVAIVRERCDEISVATGQQRSANQQILHTMRGVAQVSQQSAGIVAQLSETVTTINSQIDELNHMLSTSVRQSQLAIA
jgi:methyl-accepting chemotaxis protein